MGEWGFVAGLFLFVMGLGILAAGEVFLCLREIALNTRLAMVPEEIRAGRTQYKALRMLASLNRLIGVLVIVGGVILFSANR